MLKTVWKKKVDYDAGENWSQILWEIGIFFLDNMKLKVAKKLNIYNAKKISIFLYFKAQNKDFIGHYPLIYFEKKKNLQFCQFWLKNDILTHVIKF